MSILNVNNKKESKKISTQLKEFFSFPKDKKELVARLLPIILFLFLVCADQISKALVVKYIDLNPYSPNRIEIVGGEDWNWINLTHVRNQGIAWSGMKELSGFMRISLLIVMPLLFLACFSLWGFFSNELNKLQRWALSAIVAGGIGNIIDRIFRYASGPSDIFNGVVDWIDMAFFKIPNFTPSGRWPTFNIADASVVVGVSILIVSFVIADIKTKKEKK